jgi:predicted RNA-binding Zn-ribbon protein involved in translation (DUF1610 family)
MDASLSQSVELTCPECEQPFTVDVWLIVDAAARPDLLERIRAGTLHDLPCPHCGNSGSVDAPLLLYRPDAEPVLLFSPAQAATSQQDQEQAAGLIGGLRERLGDQWRNAWISKGLTGVPRNLLPTALEAGVAVALEEMQRQAAQHPLMQAIDALIEATSPAEVLEAVQAHPILLTDEADVMIRQGIENARQTGQEGLARHIEERYQILKQIREQGVDPEELAGLAKAEDQIAAALAGLPEYLQQILGDVSSPEELEAALKAHPELREALAATAQQASTPQSREQISLAAAWPHTCPTCGKSWEPDVWQIVDAEERPDLVKHIHDGTLHTVTCPACGETSSISAPLMYHDQAKEQLLLAVPEAWSSERGTHENRRLFPLLRAGLGSEGELPPHLERTTRLHGDLPLLSRYLRGEVGESEALPPELRRMMEGLGPELGRQFLDIMQSVSTEEELQAELEKHPELRAALGAATGTSGGAGLGEVPEDVRPILQELSRPARRADMPRRVQLCRQALSKVDRGAHAPLWGALQNAMANSLAQTPK